MDSLILVISKDYTYKDNIQNELLKRNIIADYTKSIDDALEMLVKREYLLVVICADTLDYMPGLKIMRQIRQMPILLISYTEPEDKLQALKNGAQVYIINPHCDEYIIETSVALASYYLKIKEGTTLNHPTILIYEYLYMCVETYQVFLKGKRLELTKKEFDLLRYFMTNKGITLSYEQIYSSVWGVDYNYNSNDALHSLIRRLRKKLQSEPGAKDYIRAIWEVGYKFGIK